MKKFLSILLILSFSLGTVACSDKLKKEKEYNKRVEDIMADAVEIERKWLIDPQDVPYDLEDELVQVFEIEQTYINFSPEIRVRKVNGHSYSCTMKANMTEDGMTRDELEVSITEDEYLELIKKQEGNTIHKTRYQFLTDDGNLMCIDIFHDDLDGLAYMEIEFANHEESDAYEEPDWVILEVTSDKNYKNGYLARYGIPESFYNIK